jgi:hypothetical protein
MPGLFDTLGVARGLVDPLRDNLGLRHEQRMTRFRDVR